MVTNKIEYSKEYFINNKEKILRQCSESKRRCYQRRKEIYDSLSLDEKANIYLNRLNSGVLTRGFPKFMKEYNIKKNTDSGIFEIIKFVEA